MTTATITQTPPQQRTRGATRILVVLTAVSLVTNLIMEVGVILLQPERSADFVQNLVAVVALSALGLALTWGLVRLGQRPAVRTPMAWVLLALAVPAVAMFYFLALPTTLAAGAYVLAREGSGSLRIVRLLAIVSIVASFAVSIAMMSTYL